MEVSSRFVTKFYYIGDRLVASRRGWRVGDEPFWAGAPKLIEFAGLGEKQLGVAVKVTSTGAQVLSWGIVLGAVIVLLSPQRRGRKVVGMRPSVGGSTTLALVLLLNTAPVPVLIVPAWAGGGGGNPPP